MATFDGIDPQPTLKARRMAKHLHRHLISNGTMRSPFDLRFSDLYADIRAPRHDVDSQLVQVLDIDGAEETLRIPVLTRLLRLQKSPHQCSICTDVIHEWSYGSLDEWNSVCTGYSGDWKWKVLRFPHRLEEKCNHTVDFCTECLQKYIAGQLDQYGRSGCQLLSCLSLGCSRRLEYNEVKLYASQDTFFKYDEYLKLEALSQLPSFKWCHAENCSYGQIHDLLLDNHVACEECGYEMCFEHQVSRHQGLTCEEYDSMKDKGDPRFQETRDWIATNTKPCPSCQINTQKENGCFHITCSVCRHEFCWECLASWKDIIPRPGGYNQSAHQSNCYFRSSNEQPTEIVGNSVPH